MTWLLNQDGDELINLALVPRISMRADGVYCNQQKVARTGTPEDASDLFWAICEQLGEGVRLINVPDTIDKVA